MEITSLGLTETSEVSREPILLCQSLKPLENSVNQYAFSKREIEEPMTKLK